MVCAAGAHAPYVDVDQVALVNLGPIALLSKYKLTNCSGIEKEVIDYALFFCLMYRISTSSKGSDELSNVVYTCGKH